MQRILDHVASAVHTLDVEVLYLEDTGECNIDPVANTISKEPTYALKLIDDSLRPFGLGDSWCYIDYTGRYHGHEREDWLRVCRDADLYLNLSGGSWFWRDEYARIPHSAFIDSDPGFTQVSIARGAPWWTSDGYTPGRAMIPSTVSSSARSRC